MKTEAEIQKMIDDAVDIQNKGGRFRGMTYEQGIEYALLWVLDQLDDDESPLDL